MQDIEAFRQLISTPKHIVITTHHKPDADALGSSLALWGYLKKKGHQVTVITPSDYPTFLHWMKGNDEVLVFSATTENKAAKLIQQADVIFCLDFSAYDRLDKLSKYIEPASAIKVLIDHHRDPSVVAEYNFWDVEAAATAQLIFELIDKLGDKQLIDHHIGECIYAGILTDTASFKHPSTTKKVHTISAELIDLGVRTSYIHRLIYDTNSENRLRFLGYALSEKLVLLPEYKTAYFAINAEELKKYNSQTGDTEGLVNYALSIEGMVMAAILIDRGDQIKISFRSIGDFSVSEFARNHFEGGGHKNASGGKANLNLDEALHKFLNLLPLYKEQLLQAYNSF